MSTEQKGPDQNSTQDSAPWATPKELQRRLLEAHCWLDAARNSALALGDTHTASKIGVVQAALGHVRSVQRTKERGTVPTDE